MEVGIGGGRMMGAVETPATAWTWFLRQALALV
jgi:hypothetical protein